MRYEELKTALCVLVIGILLVVAGPVRVQSQVQAQSKTDAPSQPSKDSQASSSQAGSQAPSQAESPTAAAPDSLAEAARKAREKKAKQDPPKVYTEEEMSKLSSHGVSVVGEGNGRADGGAGDRYVPDSRDQSRNREEAYWRSRARGLLSQMTAVDQQIEKVKEEIKKYGNGGFDPSTGLGKNVIYVDDRQSQLTRLQKQRSDLDKQMDQLQEEGRKAGAQPAWFR
jgi:chaperonin cofactor prefoldin